MRRNGTSNSDWEAFVEELSRCYAQLGCNAVKASEAIQHITEALNGLPRPETEDIPVPQNEMDSSKFLNQITPDPELSWTWGYVEDGGYKLYG